MSVDDADLAYYEAATQQVQSQQAIDHLLFVSDMAFAACVHTFTTNVVTPSEKTCITAVTKKYIAISLRVSSRFAELQSVAATAQLTAAQARVAAADTQLSKLK